MAKQKTVVPDESHLKAKRAVMVERREWQIYLLVTEAEARAVLSGSVPTSLVDQVRALLTSVADQARDLLTANDKGGV